MSGLNYSVGRRETIGALNRGIPMSPETCAAIRRGRVAYLESLEGKPIFSPEAIARMRGNSKDVTIRNPDGSFYE